MMHYYPQKSIEFFFLYYFIGINSGVSLFHELSKITPRPIRSILLSTLYSIPYLLSRKQYKNVFAKEQVRSKRLSFTEWGQLKKHTHTCTIVPQESREDKGLPL